MRRVISLLFAVCTFIGFVLACGARSDIGNDVASGDAASDVATMTDARARDSQSPDVMRDAPIDAPPDVRTDAPLCATDAQCNDGVVCTVDRCIDGRCAIEPDDSKCPVSQACEVAVGCEARAWAVGYSDDGFGGVIYDVRLPSGRATVVTEVPYHYADLALHPGGNVVAVDGVTLVQFRNPGASRAWVEQARTDTTIKSLNALEFAPDGTLYAAARSNVYRVDRTTGESVPVASFPAGWHSSGDIAYVGNRWIASAAADDAAPAGGDRVVEFDLANGTSRVVGAIGHHCVFGLAAFGADVYGFTCTGKILKIDIATGNASVLQTRSFTFLGAAAR